MASFTRRSLALGLCAVIGACATGPESRVVVEDVTDEALQFINAFRRENGLPPVFSDRGVIRAAETQARLMASADRLSHDVAGDLAKRLDKAGFVKNAAAENVGAGHASAERAVSSWQRSPGHRANLLMKEATRIGMVRAEAPGTRFRRYWALILVGP
jgi:uncharacterized protein YkwD